MKKRLLGIMIAILFLSVSPVVSRWAGPCQIVESGATFDALGFEHESIHEAPMDDWQEVIPIRVTPEYQHKLVVRLEQGRDPSGCWASTDFTRGPGLNPAIDQTTVFVDPEKLEEGATYLHTADGSFAVEVSYFNADSYKVRVGRK